jgi:hypothetical protein
MEAVKMDKKFHKFLSALLKACASVLDEHSSVAHPLTLCFDGVVARITNHMPYDMHKKFHQFVDQIKPNVPAVLTEEQSERLRATSAVAASSSQSRAASTKTSTATSTATLTAVSTAELSSSSPLPQSSAVPAKKTWAEVATTKTK